jgi:hypothetical protein
MSESRDVIRPSIGVEPNPVTGAMVAAINEAAAHAVVIRSQLLNHDDQWVGFRPATTSTVNRLL